MRVFGLGLVALIAACGQPSAPPLPDATVFTGGIIYTGAPASPTAEAVAVGDEGHILAVGDLETISGEVTETERVDLDGAVMFPGFVDGHAHLRGIGEREMTLNLAGVSSLAELVSRVAGEVGDTSPGAVIAGRGWIETGWPEGRMPNRADLDAVAPDNPVILIRADGHALVTNSAALDAAGITTETADPDGGRIERDEAGIATGLMIDAAMGLVSGLIATPDDAGLTQRLETGAQVYASRGWTGIHNMSVSPREAPLMAELDQSGHLPLRVHNAFDASGFEIARERQHESPRIRNRSVKLYMDGALGSRGALLIAPYADQPGTSGLALTTPEELTGFMQRAHAQDVQLAIHAIGDLANRRILEAYAGAEARNPEADRWRIEHTQILATEDITRIGELGLIASMQPSHAIGDLKFAPARLGLERLAGAYAWRSVLNGGGLIVGGSDAPVEVGSPLIEFYAAVARRDLQGESGDGWHPEQALSRLEALALFTSAPAYASFREDDLGTIEVGKLADFTVFDRDLMRIPVEQILQAEAVMTVIGGEIVWARTKE